MKIHIQDTRGSGARTHDSGFLSFHQEHVDVANGVAAVCQSCFPSLSAGKFLCHSPTNNPTIKPTENKQCGGERGLDRGPVFFGSFFLLYLRKTNETNLTTNNSSGEYFPKTDHLNVSVKPYNLTLVPPPPPVPYPAPLFLQTFVNALAHVSPCM